MQQARILIVDDDANSRTVLADALGGESYVLSEAVDGIQAVELAKENPPDLVLLDILMPKIDGIVTLQKLKADARTRHIPVIMVTALNKDTQVSVCLDEGAIDHIPKPFSGLVARARVRAALHNRRPTATVEEPVPADQQTRPFAGLVDLYFYESTVLPEQPAPSRVGTR